MPRREKRPDERVPGKPILLSRPACSADWRKSATPFAYSPGVQCRDRLTAGGRRIRTRGPTLRRAALPKTRHSNPEPFARRERPTLWRGDQKLESASTAGESF